MWLDPVKFQVRRLVMHFGDFFDGVIKCETQQKRVIQLISLCAWCFGVKEQSVSCIKFVHVIFNILHYGARTFSFRSATGSADVSGNTFFASKCRDVGAETVECDSAKAEIAAVDQVFIKLTGVIPVETLHNFVIFFTNTDCVCVEDAVLYLTPVVVQDTVKFDYVTTEKV